MFKYNIKYFRSNIILSKKIFILIFFIKLVVARRHEFGRNSGMRLVNDGNGKRVMEISNATFERIKSNGSQYGDRETFEDVIRKLLDFYDSKGKSQK